MAAGTSGNIIVRGRSGTYSRQCWFTDAVGAQMRFDSGAGVSATTGQEWTSFDEDVVIEDIVVGTTATPTATMFRLTLNFAPTTQVFLIASQLSSVVYRPKLSLFVPKGAKLGGLMMT